jgi:hypothetical protein
MSKRYVDKFLDLLRGVLRDAASLDPSLSIGLKRDYQSLATLSVEHGISVVVAARQKQRLRS